MKFPTVNLEGLRWYVLGQPPPLAAVQAVRQACLGGPGVWHVSNHGVGALDGLLGDSKAFFDRPAARKWPYSHGFMDRSRGWELYPQHRRYHLRTMALPPPMPMFKLHAETSAREGILCERYVCGPPSVCTESGTAARPFYDSDFARVFYEKNIWPDDGGALQAQMEAAYPHFERVAQANLQCVAAALGAPHTAFDELVATASAAHPDAPLRHHSRLQINNYPSQLIPGVNGPRCVPIRASRHFDTSLLTVLAREPRVDTASEAGTSGALEPCSPFLDPNPDPQLAPTTPSPES